MGRLIAGGGLLLLSLVMVWGFVRSGQPLSSPAVLGALLLTVGVPAAGAAMLLAAPLRSRGRLAARREALRRHTMEAEILGFAAEHRGRLTAVEVAARMAIPPEAAKEALDSLVAREVAELEITESGVLVYAFHDVRHLGEKSTAKGVLDA